MKKDLKPIWLYLLISIVGSVVIGIILGIASMAFNIGETDDNFISMILQIVLLLVFAIIYRKMLFDSFKSLTKKDLLKVLVFGIVTVAVNIVLNGLINTDNLNQDTVVDMLEKHKVLMTFITVIAAPVVEELVFRYSIGTLIKNKWVFLAVSAIVFGVLHALNLNVITYIFIGVMLGLIYLNTDKKIASPILVHLINNLASVVMLFLGL